MLEINLNSNGEITGSNKLPDCELQIGKSAGKCIIRPQRDFILVPDLLNNCIQVIGIFARKDRSYYLRPLEVLSYDEPVIPLAINLSGDLVAIGGLEGLCEIRHINFERS